MSRILVIDNYDSFVFTIVSYLQQLGAEVVVVRNDDDSLTGASALVGFDGVLISPGPGNPKTAGKSLEVLGWCEADAVPMLGVCLGHQALGEYYGGTVTHAPELMHGKTSQIHHDATGVFDGVPQDFTATRYHSLAVLSDTVPPVLHVNATTAEGIIMGLQHRELPLYGVQFHPESVLTEHGHRMLANWLALTGDAEAPLRSEGMAPLIASNAKDAGAQSIQ